jgi:hypothetical protein
MDDDPKLRRASDRREWSVFEAAEAQTGGEGKEETAQGKEHTTQSSTFNSYLKPTNQLRGFSPRANSTDRATAACRRS